MLKTCFSCCGCWHQLILVLWLLLVLCIISNVGDYFFAFLLTNDSIERIEPCRNNHKNVANSRNGVRHVHTLLGVEYYMLLDDVKCYNHIDVDVVVVVVRPPHNNHHHNKLPKNVCSSFCAVAWAYAHDPLMAIKEMRTSKLTRARACFADHRPTSRYNFCVRVRIIEFCTQHKARHKMFCCCQWQRCRRLYHVVVVAFMDRINDLLCVHVRARVWSLSCEKAKSLIWRSLFCERAFG